MLRILFETPSSPVLGRRTPVSQVHLVQSILKIYLPLLVEVRPAIQVNEGEAYSVGKCNSKVDKYVHDQYRLSPFWYQEPVS